MIAFGASIPDAEPYRRYAEPGIRLAAEPDSAVYAFAAVGAISRSYNLLLDAAAAREDLEALVIVHPHTEIVDPDLCRKVREVLRDPDVAVMGCAGATGVDGIAWWEGSVRSAAVVHRYEEHGGGELRAFAWAGPAATPGQVDAVDGCLLVLSPWTVRNVRFDESLALGHGYDVDLSRQVRAAGRKVVTADLRAVLHRSLELIGDLELWTEAHVRVAEKWDGRDAELPPDDPRWKERARRAEAEREAARAMAYSDQLAAEARILELERVMARATGSVSWRLTAPLRRLNRARREGVRRLRGA